MATTPNKVLRQISENNQSGLTDFVATKRNLTSLTSSNSSTSIPVGNFDTASSSFKVTARPLGNTENVGQTLGFGNVKQRAR